MTDIAVLRKGIAGKYLQIKKLCEGDNPDFSKALKRLLLNVSLLEINMLNLQKKNHDLETKLDNALQKIEDIQNKLNSLSENQKAR